MNGLMKKAGLAIALGATALTAAVPATAQRFGGGGGFHGGGGGFHGGGGFRGGGGWGGGGWRGGGWGRGGLGYGGAAVLGGLVGLGVGAAIADGGPYYGGYYGAPAYGYYGPHCWRQWRWDPYYGHRVPVRVCD